VITRASQGGLRQVERLSGRLQNLAQLTACHSLRLIAPAWPACSLLEQFNIYSTRIARMSGC
jgi:hypothetical protein